MLNAVSSGETIAIDRNNYAGEQIYKPCMVHTYNGKMGATDRRDTIVAFSKMVVKTMKWWKKSFHVLTFAAVNAYYLYKEHTTEKTPLGHRQFRLRPLHELISTVGGTHIKFSIRDWISTCLFLMEVWSDRGSTCKFRNARSAFRNLHVDPLSLHTSMRNKQVEFNPYIYTLTTLSKLYRFGYEISVFLIQNTRSLFYGRHYSSWHRLMSLHRKLNVKIFLMFIVAENTGSVNIET